MRAGRESGFSLIEVLAALSIFSVAIVALIQGMGTSLSIQTDLVSRNRAAMLAEGKAAKTINSQWGAVRAVLRLMAHRFHGNPRGRGVIDNVTYMKHVPVIHKRPRRISMDDLNRAYIA